MSRDDDLFAFLDDLEHRAEALYDAERIPELTDRSRAEYAAVTLASRLMATEGRAVDLDVAGAGRVCGLLQRVTAEWCLVRGHGQDWVVVLAAVAVVRGASDRSTPEVAECTQVIRDARANVSRDDRGLIEVTVEVFDKKHLDRVVSAIQHVPGVIAVERMNT